MTDGLAQVLAEAQRHGWIGQGPLDEQLRHAGAFTQLLGGGPVVVLDLGSGGGLPAVPCALALPESRWVLIEAQQRRADHLTSACRRLDLTDRVEVLHARAEDVGRDPARRGTADAVTSRSFGPPAVVAECAAPLLKIGGRLIVSEPPEEDDRWSSPHLAELGLSPARPREVGGYRFVDLAQESVAPPTAPRRAGIPEKSPLF